MVKTTVSYSVVSEIRAFYVLLFNARCIKALKHIWLFAMRHIYAQGASWPVAEQSLKASH